MDIKSYEVLRSFKLLYVEDEQATREEMEMMLRPWFAELYVAQDGQRGFELFKAHRPDIVLTDIQMPKVSGLAMSGNILNLAPGQPIVVVSAYNDVEYLFRAIELGIDQYITKPINVGRMLDKLVVMATGIQAVRERKLNQVLLEQYQHLVDQSAIVCKLDLSGKITFVNDKLCEVSGFTPEQLLGLEISILRHDSEPEAHCREIFAQVKSGTQWSGIIRNRTRSGEMYVVESSLVPIRNEHGTVTEILSLDVDITEHYQDNKNLVGALERSQLSLQEQRHFLKEYKHVLESGTCICVTDPQYRIRSVNSQFEMLLGYSSVELEGKLISQISPDVSITRWLDEVRQSETDDATSHVVRFLGYDGKEYQFSVGCAAVHDMAGQVESVVLICQDVTESQRLSREILETQRELLYTMGDVVESRSEETGQHVKRVAQVSRFLAIKAGLTPEFAEMIETAAPMHDIGKVGISDAILHKPGKLTAEEFDEMKRHASIGFGILGSVDRELIGLAARIAHQHHERYDGLGYPNGLRGEEISIEARIVSIADVLDALFSVRSYKPAWDEASVLTHFRQQRGMQFDPNLVDLLLLHWDEIQALRQSGGN